MNKELVLATCKNGHPLAVLEYDPEAVSYQRACLKLGCRLVREMLRYRIDDDCPTCHDTGVHYEPMEARHAAPAAVPVYR